MHVRMCKKDDICWQRRLNHSGVGGGIAFRKVYPARAYTTLVVLVFNFFHIFCHFGPNFGSKIKGWQSFQKHLKWLMVAVDSLSMEQRRKNFQTKIFSDPTVLEPDSFWMQNFFGPKTFQSNFFECQNICWTKSYLNPT